MGCVRSERSIHTRFFPSEPGGEHLPGTPHVVTFVSEFESEDATGVQAIATQESIDAIGDDIHPDARYSAYFADGPVAYEVTMFGPPDEVTREQVEEIARALYERVRGAPLP